MHSGAHAEETACSLTSSVSIKTMCNMRNHANALSATEDYAVEIFAMADEFLARVPHIFVVSTFFKD